MIGFILAGVIFALVVVGLGVGTLFVLFRNKSEDKAAGIKIEYDDFDATR